MLVKKYGIFVVRTMLHKKDMEEMYFLEKYDTIIKKYRRGLSKLWKMHSK